MAVFWVGCGNPEGTVVVFHAGSISPLIQKVFDRFRQDHPGVVLQSESSGSLDAIRKITELNKPSDLVAVADSRLIERISQVPRYHIFLGNELVLATAKKELLQEASGHRVWEKDWYERISSGQYSYGISDPNRDPAGYYAHLVWKLSEIHYDRPGLYQRILDGLDERWLRPKSSELVALLESHALDFAFLYKSTAVQNNLEFLALPPEVSLAEDAYRDLYSQVSLQVVAGQPGSTVEMTGTPVRYGIALTNPDNLWAKRLLDFFLSPEVQQLYPELGYLGVPVLEVHRQESTP
jgi:molybdate/tungstate transport system substrate-binding protein